VVIDNNDGAEEVEALLAAPWLLDAAE